MFMLFNIICFVEFFKTIHGCSNRILNWNISVLVDFSVPSHPNMVCDSLIANILASTLVSALSISQSMKLNSLQKFTFIDLFLFNTSVHPTFDMFQYKHLYWVL